LNGPFSQHVTATECPRFGQHNNSQTNARIAALWKALAERLTIETKKKLNWRAK
jgi:hypothetical protein